ncbi:hypothetical protein GCM10027168_03440 [Streptomyces capparidis]
MDTAIRETSTAPGFEEYVRARQEVLLRTARRLTANSADAQDLLQTALARTFPFWEGIADKRHADAYVRRVLVNTRTSWWRARRLEEYPTEELPETPMDDGADHRADRALMLRALAVLTRQQRGVVVLRYYEGLSTAETAAALGISTGTVKSTLHRALGRLRAELERLDRPAAEQPAVAPGRVAPGRVAAVRVAAVRVAGARVAGARVAQARVAGARVAGRAPVRGGAAAPAVRPIRPSRAPVTARRAA